MENADYTVHGARSAAQELQDISETDIKKAIEGISDGGTEFALRFRGEAATGFFKKLTALENQVSEINRGILRLADDIEQSAESKRRSADCNQIETDN